MFKSLRRKDRPLEILSMITAGAFIIGFSLFLITQVHTCVTCDGKVMKTVFDTYVCVDESAIKE